MAPVTYRTPCNAQTHASDHRARYRRRPAQTARRAPHANNATRAPHPETAGDAPASGPEEAATPTTDDRPPHVQAAAARWQRITDLNARLTATLDGDGRALWLALEEALHVHWLDVAVDHYHRGYSAGRAQASLDLTLADHANPYEKLRALSAALTDIVDALERPAPGASS